MVEKVRNINVEELKEIQLNVLQAIGTFCSEHAIVYSMACGTLLGAVRHKGYIPWDDDIDIYLLRKDYNKLMSLFPQQYQGRYELISLERDEKWDRPYAKAYDNRTVLQENANNSVIIGVNIDIYPIDDVPDEETTWLRYDKKRRFLQKMDSVKRIRMSSRRSVSKNATLMAMKIPVCWMTRRRFAILLSNYAQKYNGKGYQSVFECVQGLLQKHKFDKSLFNSVTKMPFEDRLFFGFSDYDTYLGNAYGDYMQLPPEEKQIAHHDFNAWWK